MHGVWKAEDLANKAEDAFRWQLPHVPKLVWGLRGATQLWACCEGQPVTFRDWQLKFRWQRRFCIKEQLELHFPFSLGQMKLGAIQCFVSGMKPGFLEGHLAVKNNLKIKILGAYSTQREQWPSLLQSFWLKLWSGWSLGKIYLGNVVYAWTDESELVAARHWHFPTARAAEVLSLCKVPVFLLFLNVTQKQRQETHDKRG